VQQAFDGEETTAPPEKAEEDAEPEDAEEESEQQSVIEIPEDSYRDELYEDQTTLETVRGEDGRHIVKKGLRPFFARLWADGARLDLSSIRTRVRVNEGGASEKVFTDPESDNVQHTPARMRRRMPVWHRLPDLDEGQEHDTATKLLYGVLTMLVIALPAIGYQVAAQQLNAGLVGAAVGGFVLLVESYEAVDGQLSFEPAPRHFVSADASLTILQEEFADAKRLEDYEEIAWQERTRTGMEMAETQHRRDATMTQQLNESALGIGADVLGDPLEEEADENPLGTEERRTDGSTATARADGGEHGDE